MDLTIKLNECCSPVALKMLSDEELAAAMANIIAEHESRLKSRKGQAIHVIRGLVLAHKIDLAGDDESLCPVLTEKSLAEGKRRKQYLEAILANNTSGQPLTLVEIIKQVAVVIKDPNPPSSATIWRWRNMAEDGGNDLSHAKPRGQGRPRRPVVGKAPTREDRSCSVYSRTMAARRDRQTVPGWLRPVWTDHRLGQA